MMPQWPGAERWFPYCSLVGFRKAGSKRTLPSFFRGQVTRSYTKSPEPPHRWMTLLSRIGIRFDRSIQGFVPKPETFPSCVPTCLRSGSSARSWEKYRCLNENDSSHSHNMHPSRQRGILLPLPEHAILPLHARGGLLIACRLGMLLDHHAGEGGHRMVGR